MLAHSLSKRSGTAVGADNLTEECVVFAEGYSHPLGLLLPEAGAALDVSEQEGNRSAR